MSAKYYFLRCNKTLFAINPVIRIDCNDLKFIFSNLKKSLLKGRMNLKEFEFGMKRYVFREYWHGGILRGVLKNRYFEKDCRAFREMLVLMKLKQGGINVPEPLFAGKTDGFFYNQFISTEKIDNARDLSEIDLSDRIIRLVFESIEKLFDTGLYHPDLNIKNILLRGEEVFFIDFDRAFFYKDRLSNDKRYRIYKRLFRSFHKMGKLQFFLNYKFEGYPEYTKKAFIDYLKVSYIRSFLWIFNKK